MKLLEGNVFSLVCVCVFIGGTMWTWHIMHWTSPYRDPPPLYMALDMLQHYSQSRRPHGSGHSMILPGTIPETPISPEWSWWLEWPLGVVPTASRMPTDGFVNSAVKPIHYETRMVSNRAVGFLLECFLVLSFLQQRKYVQEILQQQFSFMSCLMSFK